MPISWEVHHQLEDSIKPFGKRKWQDEVFDRAREELEKQPKSTVLELGCGSYCWITNRLRKEGRSMHVIGVDIDPVCLENKDLDESFVASATSIPLDDNSVDIVFAGWVFEHLQNPEAALNEVYRVLKPGSLLILWTPNMYNPTMLVSLLTPRQFHVIWRRMSGGHDHAENAPTFYKMNTLAKIRAFAKKAYFTCEFAESFSSAYSYFRMNKATFAAACFLNKAAVIWPLRNLRLTLVAALRKHQD